MLIDKMKAVTPALEYAYYIAIPSTWPLPYELRMCIGDLTLLRNGLKGMVIRYDGHWFLS